MPLQLDDLAALDAPTLDAVGLPLMLAIDTVDEDAEQPRHEFDANALQELADTIRERGVRQPISVRPNLRQSGRWILNFGARRLRAARLAGLMQIPAFIDTTADDYDQVIENEQREGLRPLELAMFVQKRLALGDNQSEVARRLGKSRQWVTLATAMIEPPDWLLELYRQGRCRGMMELYELRRLHGEQPQVIEAWVRDRDSITRDGVAALRAELSGVAPASARSGTSDADSDRRGQCCRHRPGRANRPAGDEHEAAAQDQQTTACRDGRTGLSARGLRRPGQGRPSLRAPAQGRAALAGAGRGAEAARLRQSLTPCSTV